MKRIFTFFDILANVLHKQIEKLPNWLYMILLIPIMLPILILAVWADKNGLESKDVL